MVLQLRINFFLHNNISTLMTGLPVYLTYSWRLRTSHNSLEREEILWANGGCPLFLPLIKSYTQTTFSFGQMFFSWLLQLIMVQNFAQMLDHPRRSARFYAVRTTEPNGRHIKKQIGNKYIYPNI